MKTPFWIVKKSYRKTKKFFRGLFRHLEALFANPSVYASFINRTPAACQAMQFAHSYVDSSNSQDSDGSIESNPLWDYFQNNNEGNGIWKWEHYFDIYQRHFSKFVGQNVNVLEIGIYSGGSLEMWRSYFGEKSHIHGVDIEEACKSYENDYVSVHIGDQEDRSFWQKFKKEVHGIDILIDDGGHSPEQQRATLEEMLPYLNPGGVYLCEDITTSFRRFSSYATGLVQELNQKVGLDTPLLQTYTSPFQSMAHSIHFYPYVVVIEKHSSPVERLSCPKHGTEWQPFL